MPPVRSVVSQQLFNFASSSNTYVSAFPNLAGCRFGELAFRFPDAILLGVVHGSGARVTLNPPVDYKV